jgi:hypothetical protein
MGGVAGPRGEGRPGLPDVAAAREASGLAVQGPSRIGGVDTAPRSSGSDAVGEGAAGEGAAGEGAAGEGAAGEGAAGEGAAGENSIKAFGRA